METIHHAKVYDSVSVHIQAMRVYWRQPRRPALNSYREHIAIFESLREWNFEKVKDALTTHIVSSGNDVIRVLNEHRGPTSGKRSTWPVVEQHV